MPNRNYLVEGSSNSVTGLYPTIYVAASSIATTLTNVAVAGNGIADFEGRVASNNALLVGGAMNLMTMYPFNNDIGGDGNPDGAGNLAILNRYYTLLGNYRTAGWKVVLISANPYGDAWAAGATWAGNYNTVVAEYHSRLAASVGTYIDVMINWWSDVNYGYAQRNNLSNYADGVHLSNPAGQTYLAKLIQPHLDGIVTPTKMGRLGLRA